MNDVDVCVEVEGEFGDVEALARRVLDAARLVEAELSVVITDDAAIRALNATWRQKDEATDVLSFPQQEAPVVGGMLGDVVISVETAAVQAAEAGHDLEAELAVLLVHGVAHLLGYDHLDDEEAVEMAAVEARLLAVAAPGVVGLVVRGSAKG